MTDAPKVSAPSRPIHRVSPPPVHHPRITAAPLKWELQPPPPTSCFKATLMPQGHKRLTHTYDAFKSLSHTSPVREVGLTFKTHSLAALVIPSLWFQVMSGLLWTEASPQLEMVALHLPLKHVKRSHRWWLQVFPSKIRILIYQGVLWCQAQNS